MVQIVAICVAVLAGPVLLAIARIWAVRRQESRALALFRERLQSDARIEGATQAAIQQMRDIVLGRQQ